MSSCVLLLRTLITIRNTTIHIQRFQPILGDTKGNRHSDSVGSRKKRREQVRITKELIKNLEFALEIRDSSSQTGFIVFVICKN